MASRHFAITDIHGCSNTLDALLDRIAFSTSDQLFLLGDYIDRGPNSKGVLDRLLTMMEQGYSLHLIRGNHEQLLLDALGSTTTQLTWELGVGASALTSFGVPTLSEIPKKYVQLIDNTQHFIELPGYLLVHAGLNFTHTDPLIDKHAMLWARNWQAGIRPGWLGSRIIVHGHTPLPLNQLLSQFNGEEPVLTVNLDNGCSLKRECEGYGNLCAYDLFQQQLYIQPNKD